jgi:hypothetical protein
MVITMSYALSSSEQRKLNTSTLHRAPNRPLDAPAAARTQTAGYGACSVGEQQRGADMKERGEHPEGRPSRCRRRRCGPCATTGEYGVTALIKHVDAEDLEHGRERHACRRRWGLIALDHVEERE